MNDRITSFTSTTKKTSDLSDRENNNDNSAGQEIQPEAMKFNLTH